MKNWRPKPNWESELFSFQLSFWNSTTINGTLQNRTHNAVHELTAIENTPLTYDVKGNLTGNTNGHTYTWDFDNRLSGADTDGNSADDLFYQYDALGRRVRKDNGTSNTVFVLAGQQVIAEYASGAAPASPSEQYVYASYIDEPILKTGTGGSVYYSRNRQYSITALTSSTGAPLEYYAYDSHGKLAIFDPSATPISATQYANFYTYTGRQFEAETDLYYFRARYFDPALGRFIGRDPIGIKSNDNCLYRFASSNPVNRVDPSGLDWVWPWDPAASWDPRDTADLWGADWLPGYTIGEDLSEETFKLMGYMAWRELVLGGGYPADGFIVGPSHVDNHWQHLMDDWFWEKGAALRTFVGTKDPRNRDIMSNVGFQKLVDCWLAKKFAPSTYIPEGRWSITNTTINWQYTWDRVDAAGGAKAFTRAIEFIGGYTATLAATKTVNGKCDVSVVVVNTSSWDSATRFPGRFRRVFGGRFSMFPAHPRGAGKPPSRGGNMTQNYIFTLSNLNCCPKCILP